MITLILARHGNTFAAGDAVVYAGSQNDLPLVADGEAQARRLASFAQQQGWQPSAILHSRLQRTRRFALIVQEIVAPTLPLQEDNRLDEIDYGAWTGQTTAAIIARFGQASYDAWDKHSQWPSPEQWPKQWPKQWKESEAAAMQRAHAFLADVASGHYGIRPFAVTSNGLLRLILRADADFCAKAHSAQTHKVRTGHFCIMHHTAGEWRVIAWNSAAL